jgi:hypothetical protein
MKLITVQLSKQLQNFWNASWLQRPRRDDAPSRRRRRRRYGATHNRRCIPVRRISSRPHDRAPERQGARKGHASIPIARASQQAGDRSSRGTNASALGTRGAIRSAMTRASFRPRPALSSCEFAVRLRQGRSLPTCQRTVRARAGRSPGCAWPAKLPQLAERLNSSIRDSIEASSSNSIERFPNVFGSQMIGVPPGDARLALEIGCPRSFSGCTPAAISSS